MDISLVVEHPPEGLVAFDHLVGKDTSGDGTFKLLFHGGDHRPAEVIVEVIIGIITILGNIFAVAVGIVERCQVEALVFGDIAMGRPFFNFPGNGIVVARDESARFRVGMGDEFIHHGPCDLYKFIVLGAGFLIHCSGSVNGKRSVPVVDAHLPVTLGCQLELVVDFEPADPQCAGKHRGCRTGFGDEILGSYTARQVPPHVAAGIDPGPDIVDVKPIVG